MCYCSYVSHTCSFPALILRSGSMCCYATLSRHDMCRKRPVFITQQQLREHNDKYVALPPDSSFSTHACRAHLRCWYCMRYTQVERVFTLSVSELLDPSFRATDDLGPRGKLPAFTAGPSRVWGLTAVIADGVLRNGIVPSLEQAAAAPLAERDNVGGDGAPRRRHDVPRNDKGPGSSSL